MNLSTKTVRENFSRKRERLFGSNPARKYTVHELPLRSELFRADQMTEIAAKDSKSLIPVIADMARSAPSTGSKRPTWVNSPVMPG